MLHEDINAMGTVREEDVRDTRKQVLDLYRKLVDEGHILEVKLDENGE